MTASARDMGAKIRELRDAADLSQMALGARAGMHYNYVGILERGEVANPGLVTVARIATGLHVSIAVLTRAFIQDPVSCAKDAAPREPKAVAPGAPKALGQGLALLRAAAGHTQLGLARASSIHRAYIGSLETGNKGNPGLWTVTRLVRPLALPGEAVSTLVERLAQLFAGEISVEQFRAALSVQASGPADHQSVPQGRSAH